LTAFILKIWNKSDQSQYSLRASVANEGAEGVVFK